MYFQKKTFFYIIIVLSRKSGRLTSVYHLIIGLIPISSVTSIPWNKKALFSCSKIKSNNMCFALSYYRSSLLSTESFHDFDIFMSKVQLFCRVSFSQFGFFCCFLGTRFRLSWAGIPKKWWWYLSPCIIEGSLWH